MSPLLLSACTGAPDDTGEAGPDRATVLVELAQAMNEVARTLIDTIGDRFDDLEDGESTSGVVSYPDGAASTWTLDGEMTIAWTVGYHEDPDEPGLRWYGWTLDLDLARLALPSADVAGTAAWTVHDERYDYWILNHDWDGTVSVDAAEAVDATWVGSGTPSTLNTMSGTIDGELVEWENPAPDVP